MEAINKYFNFLYECFMYDIDVFSTGWIYYWLLIPAMFYLMFFMIKWWLLTMPMWLPLKIIASAFNPNQKRKKQKLHKNEEL